MGPAAFLNLPHVPPVKTRAPASQDLIDHFREEGWYGQARPRGRLVNVMVDASGELTLSDPRVKIEARTGLLARNLLRPQKGWNVFLAVRQHRTGTLWIIDCLMWEGRPLGDTTLMGRLIYLPISLVNFPEMRSSPVILSPIVFRNVLVAQHDILFRHPTLPGWCRDGMVLLTAPRA